MISDLPLEIHVLDYLRCGELKPPNIVEMTDFFEDHIKLLSASSRKRRIEAKVDEEE
jgi:hypothetical protein